MSQSDSQTKRALHHTWTKLRPINAWYFLAAAAVFLGVGLYAMRQNNLTALRLRDKVLAADEANGDVEGALKELREFVYGHMNADLAQGPNAIKPPIQLKYRYERLVQAQNGGAATDNAQIYQEAQRVCEQRFPAGLSGSGRIPCITEYVSARRLKEVNIPDSLYKFDFVAPAWSPDLAGISLLLSGVFFILFLARFTLERWLKHSLKQHA